MRLDLGPDGKIIGTRRVSPNGQVSGLSDYAGREVLVILPGSGEAGYAGAWPGTEEVVRMVNEQMRQAYDQYRTLQESYASPWEATRSFLEAVYGTQFPDLMAEVDRWVKSQVDRETGRPPHGRSGASERPPDGGSHRSAPHSSSHSDPRARKRP